MPPMGVNKNLTVEFKRIIKNSLAINFHLYPNKIPGTSSKSEIFARYLPNFTVKFYSRFKSCFTDLWNKLINYINIV